jgi:hypothetical protein
MEVKIQPELEAWIKGGNEVRVDPDGLLAGRCGAELLRGNGSDSKSEGNGTRYCHRAAGWGTGFRNGRCRHHLEHYSTGLMPWAGTVDPEEWLRITGASTHPGVAVHGAGWVDDATKHTRSFEGYIRGLLDPDDRDVFDAVEVDPVRVVDSEIRLNRVQAARLYRYLQERRTAHLMDAQVVGSTRREIEEERAEAALRDLSKTLARLLEVRARYSELADSRRQDDHMRDLLKDLPAEQFAALRSDPSRLRDFYRN